jgi:hypothetical protein
VAAKALDVGGHIVVLAREHVDLDDPDVLDERRVLLVPGEVVEGDRVAELAELAQRLEQLVVDALVLEQLEHDPLGRQGERQLLDDEIARHVEPGGVVAHEPLEPDLGEGVDDDRGGGRVGVVDDRNALVGAPEEQLVTPQVELTVKDWLPGYIYVGHGPTSRRLSALCLRALTAGARSYLQASVQLLQLVDCGGGSGRFEIRPRVAAARDADGPDAGA